MKGRKPTPTRIKLDRGNPSKRPINHREPQLSPGQREAPSRLTPRAREIWDEVAGELIDAGQLRSADMGLFEEWCSTKAELELTAARLRKVAQEELVEHRHLLVHSRGLKTIYKGLSAELGLSPTSRSRVVAAPAAVLTEHERRHQRFFGTKPSA
jgi:P27 family predicted phage terminase small subunit